jgi:quercetin dioxygenase-like cupin family protein
MQCVAAPTRLPVTMGLMAHHRWADIPSEQINESIARRFITGDSLTVARFELKKGGVVPSHAHVHEQVSVVMTGALRFTVDGQNTIVRAGEVMQIPSNAVHSVEALEDALVIDVFSPVRQDWIDKTDAYFNR